MIAGLSDEDLARIVNRLTGMLGGTGDAWHGGPCVGACPDTARQFIELGARMLSAGPDITETIPADVAGYIDHTILKPDATLDMIRKIVSEAREHSFRSVCVNPSWVRVAIGRYPCRNAAAITCEFSPM